MLELNDSSTSCGSSVSVRVGEGTGDEEREEPAIGDEEKSMVSEAKTGSTGASVK
jgi:hypothetical protein